MSQSLFDYTGQHDATGGASIAAKIDCSEASQRLRCVVISPSVTVTPGVVRNRSPWYRPHQISSLPRENRIKQSIDLAPPPRVSTQSICVYQPIWLPIFCCLQTGILFFSSLLFSSFLLPHLFGDPSAYLPYHAAKPSIYAPICLSNYILASICLTISLSTHSPVNHAACLGCRRFQLFIWVRLCLTSSD